MSLPRAFSIFILVLFPCLAYAQGKLDGIMFIEYYFVQQHHDGSLEDRHGFWFRRIYLTYNEDLSARFRMRFRLEMASPGDFVSNDKLVPFVKDAFLGYETDRHAARLGLIPTPTWDDFENFWGWRALEKTPLDLQGWGSSRDLGISLSGVLSRRSMISYWIMYGNGSSERGETNRGKKLYGRLGWRPLHNLSVDIYGDQEWIGNGRNGRVFQASAGLEHSRGRLGLQIARRRLRQEGNQNNGTLLSAFGVMGIIPTVNAIIRCDWMFEANPVGPEISYIPFSGQAPFRFFIGAIAWEMQDNIWLIPNIKWVYYDRTESGERPGVDLYLNLTASFKF